MPTLMATIQFKPRWGAPRENREKILRLLEQGAVARAQLVVLPEMCTTGYVFFSPAEISPLCEEPRGETFELFAAFCKSHGVFLAYGYAEKAGKLFFNSQNLVGPSGELVATYRKTHLYEQDYYWAAPGDTGFVSLDTEIGRIGLGICMDINFDDFVEFHSRAKTELICFSSCWLDEGFPIIPYWQSRLRGYRGAICIADSFGEERGINFRGESAVLQGGIVLARAGVQGEKILSQEIG